MDAVGISEFDIHSGCMEGNFAFLLRKRRRFLKTDVVEDPVEYPSDVILVIRQTGGSAAHRFLSFRNGKITEKISFKNEAVDRRIHVTFVYSCKRNEQSVRNTAVDFYPSLWVRRHVLPRCSCLLCNWAHVPRGP